MSRPQWPESTNSLSEIPGTIHVATEGIDCDWRRHGHLYLAYKRAHFAAMQKSVVWYRNTFGHEVTAVAPSDLHTEIGSRVFHGGVTDAHSGGLQPAKYVYGLAKAVAQHGAHLHERADGAAY